MGRRTTCQLLRELRQASKNRLRRRGATRASAVKAKGKEIDAPAPKKGVKKGKARSKKDNGLSTKESVEVASVSTRTYTGSAAD